MRRADQLNAGTVLQTIESVIQSNERFLIDGPMHVKCFQVKKHGSKAKGKVDYSS